MNENSNVYAERSETAERSPLSVIVADLRGAQERIRLQRERIYTRLDGVMQPLVAQLRSPEVSADRPLEAPLVSELRDIWEMLVREANELAEIADRLVT